MNNTRNEKMISISKSNKIIISSVNSLKNFALEIVHTDSNIHQIKIQVNRVIRQDEDNIICDKSYKKIFELEELKELSGYFIQKCNTIEEIFKEIKSCIKMGLFELYDSINSITIIFIFSTFIDFNYKVPFLLPENNINNKIANNANYINIDHNMNTDNNNKKIFNKDLIEKKDELLNNDNEGNYRNTGMIGNKRSRNEDDTNINIDKDKNNDNKKLSPNFPLEEAKNAEESKK